jgi:hypothetical protein
MGCVVLPLATFHTIKQEVLGNTNRPLPLTQYGRHRKRHVQEFFFLFCMYIRCCGNVFTELLPSNDMVIFIELLPSNDRGIHLQIHRVAKGIYEVRR